MQYLKNTTRLHNRKYVMIEQQISPHTWSLLVTAQNTWVFPPTITQARIRWEQTAQSSKKIFSSHNQTCSANGTASQRNMQDASQACKQKGGEEQSIYTRMPSTKIEWIMQNSYSYFELKTYYNPMTIALKVYNKYMHCIWMHQERPTLHNKCIYIHIDESLLS